MKDRIKDRQTDWNFVQNFDRGGKWRIDSGRLRGSKEWVKERQIDGQREKQGVWEGVLQLSSVLPAPGFCRLLKNMVHYIPSLHSLFPFSGDKLLREEAAGGAGLWVTAGRDRHSVHNSALAGANLRGVEWPPLTLSSTSLSHRESEKERERERDGRTVRGPDECKDWESDKKCKKHECWKKRIIRQWWMDGWMDGEMVRPKWEKMARREKTKVIQL